MKKPPTAHTRLMEDFCRYLLLLKQTKATERRWVSRVRDNWASYKSARFRRASSAIMTRGGASRASRQAVSQSRTHSRRHETHSDNDSFISCSLLWNISLFADNILNTRSRLYETFIKKYNYSLLQISCNVKTGGYLQNYIDKIIIFMLYFYSWINVTKISFLFSHIFIWTFQIGNLLEISYISCKQIPFGFCLKKSKYCNMDFTKLFSFIRGDTFIFFLYFQSSRNSRDRLNVAQICHDTRSREA